MFFEIFNSQKSDQISHEEKSFLDLFFVHGFHLGLAKNILKVFDKKVLSYVTFSQIWLNLTTDDCHFGYITKLRKRKVTDHHHHQCPLIGSSSIDRFIIHQSVHHPSINPSSSGFTSKDG
jgi:hypothetical protein